MKYLGLFCIFLILNSSAYAININSLTSAFRTQATSNSLLSSSTHGIVKENFFNLLSKETPDDGVFIDIDNTKIFREKIVINTLDMTYSAGFIEPLQQTVEIPDYGKNLARLEIEYTIGAFYYLQHSSLDCALTVYFDGIGNDDIITDYYIRDYGSNYNRHNIENFTLRATLYNVTPGSHTIRVKSNNSVLIGRSAESFSFIDFYGEYVDKNNRFSKAGLSSDKFVTYSNEIQQRRINGIVFASVDDVVQGLDVNNSNLRYGTSVPSPYQNNWYDIKKFDIKLAENDLFSFKGKDNGGREGIFLNLLFYNKNGLPEIVLSDYTWICDKVNASQNDKGFYDSIKNTYSFRPSDRRALYIWGKNTNIESTCEKKLESKLKGTSVIYVHGSKSINYLKVNNKQFSSGFSNFSDIENYSTITQNDIGFALKSGDIVEIKSENAKNTNTSVINYIKGTGYENYAMITASITYKDKFNQVTTITTSTEGWICSSKANTVVYNNSKAYTEQLFLNVVFNTFPIYDKSSSTTSVCKITLP